MTCRELLDELAETLQSKLSFTTEQTLDTVADLLTFLSLVPIAGKLKVVAADPHDDKVLECAATIGATPIITGDRRHPLPLGIFQGISILTAADFPGVATGTRKPRALFPFEPTRARGGPTRNESGLAG